MSRRSELIGACGAFGADRRTWRVAIGDAASRTGRHVGWLLALLIAGCGVGGGGGGMLLDAGTGDPDAEICEPDCEGRDCGNDGCGGECGTCDEESECVPFEWVCKSTCEPNCDGLACGDDGCGGECGACEEEETCEEGVCEPDEPPPLSDADRALARTNEIRQSIGLGDIQLHGSITRAAQSHALYYQRYCDEYNASGLSPHNENREWSVGFSGVEFWERMEHFGFQGNPGGEVIHFLGDPVRSVDDWVDSLYHRIPFVSAHSELMGYGIARGECAADVIDFGSASSVSRTRPVSYPFNGQTGVPSSWNGMENPQPPLPPGISYPSGPIITLTFPAGVPNPVSEHELEDPDGDAIEHQWVTPSNDPHGSLSDTLSMYAYDPLEPQTEYTVRIVARYEGSKTTWEWTFTTGD